MIGDDWFLEFINGENGPFNEQLYYKYINRILSYPLSAERIYRKRLHGNQLIEQGYTNESIKIYEEALLEANELGELNQKLIILKKLAYSYTVN